MCEDETIDTAVKIWGENLVHQTVGVVTISDPHIARGTFEDLGLFDQLQIVEFIYFNEPPWW